MSGYAKKKANELNRKRDRYFGLNFVSLYVKIVCTKAADMPPKKEKNRKRDREK